MNGWLRLWVLVSVVWAVLVVSVAAIVIPDKLQAIDPATAGPIESGSKYGGIPGEPLDELPAGFVIEPPKASQERGPVDELPEGFVLDELLLEIEENQHERQEVIRTSIMVSIIPPLVLLLLGYGFAWVLRGFGSNR